MVRYFSGTATYLAYAFGAQSVAFNDARDLQRFPPRIPFLPRAVLIKICPVGINARYRAIACRFDTLQRRELIVAGVRGGRRRVEI